ncbi:MAG: hypothetical protein ACE5EM_04885 [Sphingomonadales bacterium]
MKRFVICAAMALTFWAGGARADSAYDRALSLFHDGAFEEASDLASRIETADGLALAARARLAHAAYVAPPGENLDALTQSQALARRALEADPDNVEALLHLSIALGYQARTEGYIKAHFAGRAREARKLLDRALVLDPEGGWSHTAMGGWHAELVVAGGGLLAAALYRASAKKAIFHFREAIAAQPENPVMHVEFAKALLRMKLRKYRTMALEQLDIALTLEPSDAFERMVQDKGRLLRAALNEGDRRMIKALLVKLEPFAAHGSTGRPR